MTTNTRAFFGGRIVRFGLLAVVAGAAAGLGGCNARSNELMDTNRGLTDRNVALTQEVESLQAANASLQAAVDARDRTIAAMQADFQRLGGANQDLLRRMQEWDERLRSQRFGGLDPTTDAALRELAAKYPDVMIYDADRGMIRFTSDLTFGSGSADVTAQGKASLQALGNVLQSPSATGYDIRVVGHTDSQRISSGTAQRHPTNMHLSAHRAISVFNELRGMGIVPERMEVAGRGEHMPMVPNTANGNTPQNRRVEIYLVRSTRQPGAPAGAAPTTTPARPAARPQEDTIK